MYRKSQKILMKTKSFLNKLLQFKIHKLIFGTIIVAFACTVKYYLAINASNLTENIYLGIFCLSLKLYIFDFLDVIITKYSLDVNLGQVLWGRLYMGGDLDNNYLLSTTNTPTSSNTTASQHSSNTTTPEQNTTTTVTEHNSNTAAPEQNLNTTTTEQNLNTTATEQSLNTTTTERALPTIPSFLRNRLTIPMNPTDSLNHWYAMYWSERSGTAIIDCMNEVYDQFLYLSPEQKLLALDILLGKLAVGNTPMLLYYDDLCIIKYMSSLGLFPPEVTSKIGPLGHGDTITRKGSAFRWLKTDKVLVRNELTNKRDTLIDILGIYTNNAAVQRTEVSTVDLSNTNASSSNTNVVAGPSNTSSSPILSQIDPRIWGYESSDSDSDSDSDSNLRPKKRARISEQDPTGNRKGKERE